MKNITKLLLFLALFAANSIQAQVLQDYWNFDNDDNGDSLGAILNTGALNSAWDGPAAGGDAADGLGNWVVTGDSGTLQREAPAYGEYAFAPTTGRHRLEVDFASWNLDALSEGDSLVFRLDESVAAGGGNLARIELRVNGGIAQIRQSTDLVSGSAFRTTNLTLVEASGATVAIEFDFDTDMVYYIVNGSVTNTFDDFDGADIAQLRYQKNGVWSTAASSVVVNSFGWVTVPADETALEYFTFDTELAGDRLQEIENTGSLGSTWNINGAGGDAADGSGAWTIVGDSGALTRKLPDPGYAAPITTGRYRLEADFASWNFDAASVGDSINLRLNESGGGTIAQIQLRVLSASVAQIRLSGDFGSGSSFRTTDFSLAELAGANAAIEFDFDSDEAFYIVNGVITEAFTDFTGADIAQTLYVKNGAWSTAASTASLDSFGFRSVAEPFSDPNAQEFWDFEYDEVEAEFDGIFNSGVLGTAWDFPGAKGDGANGLGQWSVTGDSTTITRKVPATDYSSPVTTGTYRFVVDFASWSMDAASAGDSLSIRLNESVAAGGSTVAQVTFEVSATEVTLKWSSSSTASNNAFRSEVFPLSSADGVRMEVEFDFDNDVFTYYLNGVFKHRFTDFNGDDIGQLLYVKNGAWTTAASSLEIEEFGYVSVPSDTVIDRWNFSDADGSAPANALSNNGINLGGNPPAAVAQVSGGQLVFGSDGVESGLFTASDLSEDPITSGIIEVSFKVTAASFNNTFANSTLPARVGFRLQDRQDGNKNLAVLKIVYDPVENQFQANAEALGSGSVTVPIQTGSPVLLEDVTLRMLVDLDEPTVPGSYQAFFTYGDGEEQLVVFDGVVGEAFGGTTQVDILGIIQQLTNGGTDWQVGDTVTVDDLVVQRSGPVYRPVFLDIAYNGTNGVLSFDTVNTLEYSIKATGSLDTGFVEIDTVTGDGTRVDYTDTRGSFGQQFYLIDSGE